MPPDVPATVKAGVVVGVATVIIPPVNETLVTVPVPEIADQLGFALGPFVLRKLPDVPAASAVHSVALRYKIAP